jgi:MEDS: MEthanogen/methylotroph, DcmR Sensory domain
VLIMADVRCESIIGRLAKAECDLEELLDSGRLECISADSMLKEFMESGTLDERLVEDTLGNIATRAKANSPTGKVRIFGEMVSLLLAKNDVSTAERLEVIWNQIIQTHSIFLFCTYTLPGTQFKRLPESLALLHSHKPRIVSLFNTSCALQAANDPL